MYTGTIIEAMSEMNNQKQPRHPSFFDSLLKLLRFLISSASATVVDVAGFYLLSLLLTPALGEYSIAVCTVLARAVSSLFNFTLNRRVVFESRKNPKRALLRYYMLAVPQMLCSIGLVYGLTLLFGQDGAFLKTVFKAIADTFLFLISFFIQREWVFKND